jgi:PAS domain S-box-containing protein
MNLEPSFDPRALGTDSLLQLAGRVARIGGWSVDLRTRQVQWSDEVGRIHETPPGWQPSVDEGIAFYAPEHRALIAEAFGRCAELGEPYDLELQILTAHGRRVWVHTAGQAERDASGRIVRVYGAFHDIDARKRAELALARMNRLYALQGGIAEAIVAEPDDAQALLQRVCQIAVERGGFALAWLARRTDTGRSCPVCAAGDDAGWFELLRERAADPAFDHWPLADAIGAGRFVAIEDTQTDPRLGAWTEPLLARGWRTAAAVPLSAGGEHRLGLVLLGADPQSFGDDETRLLAAIGQTLAHALIALAQRAERDAAMSALRRREAELRSAQRIAGVGGWNFDPLKRRLRMSPAALTALGLAADPFEGSPHEFLAWIHPDDRERVRRAMQAAGARGSMYDVEHRILREDGGTSWLHSRAEPTPQPDGSTLWVGSVLDVTAHKQAELRLREQVGRLALLDRITRAIGERLELDGVLRIVTTQVEAHLPAELCAVLVRDAVQPARLRLGAAGGSAAAVARAALAALTAAPDGAPAPALADAPLAVPVLVDAGDPLLQQLAVTGLGSAVLLPLDRPGAPLGLMLVARSAPRGFGARDVEFLQQLTEHVAIAARQAGLHSDLRRAYETLERTQAARLQQERLAALGSMAGGAAHDINNALSPAALYVESLLARETGISARGREQLGAIQRAIDDVADTVERMRDFSRRGQADVQPCVDLGAVARTVAGHAGERWGDARRPHGTAIEVRIVATDAPLPVRGVEAELVEALAELVANAVDAMPGGGTLTLQAMPGDDGGAVLAVIDEGAGMDEPTRRRCVEPFFTTKGERGSGMGLARVWGAAERHGARLRIDSAPGRGTTVTLNFPREEHEAPTAPPPAPPRGAPASLASRGLPSPPAEHAGPAASPPAPPNPRCGKAGSCSAGTALVADAAAPPRVLVVDDDELLRGTLAQILQSEPLRLVLAAGGLEAIDAATAAAAAGDPFDVVLTDLGMPGIDGQQVAAAVKRLQPPPRVVMLTGWGRGMVADDTLPPHVDQLLPKPPRLADLRAVLRDAGRPDAGRRPGSE